MNNPGNIPQPPRRQRKWGPWRWALIFLMVIATGFGGAWYVKENHRPWWDQALATIVGFIPEVNSPTQVGSKDGQFTDVHEAFMLHSADFVNVYVRFLKQVDINGNQKLLEPFLAERNLVLAVDWASVLKELNDLRNWQPANAGSDSTQADFSVAHAFFALQRDLGGEAVLRNCQPKIAWKPYVLPKFIGVQCGEGPPVELVTYLVPAAPEPAQIETVVRLVCMHPTWPSGQLQLNSVATRVEGGAGVPTYDGFLRAPEASRKPLPAISVEGDRLLLPLKE